MDATGRILAVLSLVVGTGAESLDHDEIDAFLDRSARQVLGRPVLCVGTDLVDIDDIRAILARQPQFAERHFTAVEREYCLLTSDPAGRFAARFAVKEAVLKAFGTGLSGARLRDIEVVRRDSGQPALVLAGRASRLAETAGVRSWLITMTHSRHLAHAFVAGFSSGPY